MTANLMGTKTVPLSRGDAGMVNCPRCGIRRKVHSGTLQAAKDKLCRDCRFVEPDWPESVTAA